MLIDFHAHTRASDGELSPDVLLARAVEAEVELFAITDHDTINGFLSVQNCVPAGVRLLPGVEISCVWGATTIHVVGLGFDPDAEPIRAMLDTLDSARVKRAEQIAKRLEKCNMLGALDGAMTVAGDSQIGRPHFARWMVDSGYVVDVTAAFGKYLGQGKIGDVKTFWPQLSAVVDAIALSGGEAILAHPLKYRFTRMKLDALCRDFALAGGAGIEVLNGRQSVDEISRLRRIAQAFELHVSAGSDFHRDWQYGAGLGVDTAVAAGLPAIWDRYI